MPVNTINEAIEQIFAQCGPHIKLAAPLGLGKPNHLLNAIYTKVKSNPKQYKLTIYSALSLQVPVAKSDLEKRFLAPFVNRHFGDDYPHLQHILDRNNNQLASNVELHEFYFSSGSQLHNSSAQQNYISQNYTHVARDLAAADINVVVQQVARRGSKISLSSNPDVILDLIDKMQSQQKPLMVIGVINPALPFLGGDAEVGTDTFNLLLDDQQSTRLFAIPRESVSKIDHAIGLHASTLVKDGGTLQIGIGALSDAIVNALILRQQNNSDYITALDNLSADWNSQLVIQQGGSKPLAQGLYGATEMVMDGFMHLRRAGILTREVFDDLQLQYLLDQKLITNPLTSSSLQQLIKHELIDAKITDENFQWLKHFGLLPASCELDASSMQINAELCIGRDLNETAHFKKFNDYLQGRHLKQGRYLEGAFYLGSKELYSWFKQLSEADWSGLWMRRVSHINELLGGHETLDRNQRRHARFFNTCMMHTLSGAAISDGLENGQVVSGVGGQYNFVAMAHSLDDGRSIIMLRATRTSAGTTISNIRWNYAHTTIPRHLRDIVITEYGIADLRGQSDQEVIKRLLAITDARFQVELLAEAKAAGKIDNNFGIPLAWKNNLPEKFDVLTKNKNFSAYPFGSDFDEVEQHLARALVALKQATATPFGKIKSLFKCLLPQNSVNDNRIYLARMALENPQGFKQRLTVRMLNQYL